MVRKLTLGLVSLVGILIGLLLAIWLHDLVDGVLHPAKVLPLEDWLLGLGIASGLIQITAMFEVLVIAVLTRRRWIPYQQGRSIVGLLSLVGLSQAIFGLWISYGSLIWGLGCMVPFGVAAWLVKENRAVADNALL